MRIAFRYSSQAGWVAELHYFRNLLAAVSSLEPPARPATVLLIGTDTPAGADGLRGLADEVLVEPPLSPARRVLTQALASAAGRASWLPPLGTGATRWLRQQRIDVLFAAGAHALGVRLPTISWIPDFQHLHLPHLFSREELLGRSLTSSAIASQSTVVLLSSQSALADFMKFSPRHARKGRSLPFVAQMPSSVYESDPSRVVRQYNLPERFVYLPNQFWAHKNHVLVLDALSKLRDTHPEVKVVCTGTTGDYRAPTYFGTFLAQTAERRLRDRLIVLGLVPHDVVQLLMRQALALLQPSLFEGWSTTVEEAKSLGKRLLLSDIPVHREQADADALFFDTHDADALADRLAEVFETMAPGPDRPREATAQAALPQRTREYGQAFVEIAETARG